jgi:hypothetical protein
MPGNELDGSDHPIEIDNALLSYLSLGLDSSINNGTTVATGRTPPTSPRTAARARTSTMPGNPTERDDDDSALEESEQFNRPLDNALRQQRIEAWHPVLDPVWVIFALFYLGVIFVPTGTYFIFVSSKRCDRSSFCVAARNCNSNDVSLFLSILFYDCGCMYSYVYSPRLQDPSVGKGCRRDENHVR